MSKGFQWQCAQCAQCATSDTSNRRRAHHTVTPVSPFCGANRRIQQSRSQKSGKPGATPNGTKCQTIFAFCAPPLRCPFCPSSSWYFLRCPLFLLSTGPCLKLCGVAECGIEVSAQEESIRAEANGRATRLQLQKPRPHKGEKRRRCTSEERRGVEAERLGEREQTLQDAGIRNASRSLVRVFTRDSATAEGQAVRGKTVSQNGSDKVT